MVFNDPEKMVKNFACVIFNIEKVKEFLQLHKRLTVVIVKTQAIIGKHVVYIFKIRIV